jgi:hypothetical protein
MLKRAPQIFFLKDEEIRNNERYREWIITLIKEDVKRALEIDEKLESNNALVKSIRERVRGNLIRY